MLFGSMFGEKCRIHDLLTKFSFRNLVSQATTKSCCQTETTKSYMSYASAAVSGRWPTLTSYTLILVWNTRNNTSRNIVLGILVYQVVRHDAVTTIALVRQDHGTQPREQTIQNIGKMVSQPPSNFIFYSMPHVLLVQRLRSHVTSVVVSAALSWRLDLSWSPSKFRHGL